MAIAIPTTKELHEQNLSNLEGKLNQTSPLADKAFLRVLSAMEALAQTGQYKFAAYQAMQALAMTADEPGLELIGQEFGVIRKPAEPTVLEISLPGDNGTVIPATVDFVGANGVRYYPTSSTTVSGNYADITVTAEKAGVIGNVNYFDKLSIGSQIAGAFTRATVMEIINTGADIEALETYRARVLAVERGATGGGNANDYKIWAEEVAGVKRAYPYAGKPFGSNAQSYPGDRTIYIECQTSIDPYGIPPLSLLNGVRESVNTNPNTLKDRPPLGLTDNTLYIEPISRQRFYVTIGGLTIQTDIEEQVKVDIETALESYFASLAPFVIGIDFQEDRRDRITAVTVAEIVQNVLTGSGGSAESVIVGTSQGGSITSFDLIPGLLARLAEEPLYV